MICHPEFLMQFFELIPLLSNLCQVILRILETPLLDILIILLLVRIFFPRLFGYGRKNQPEEKTRVFMRKKPERKSSENSNKDGEYIEYEEIK